MKVEKTLHLQHSLKPLLVFNIYCIVAIFTCIKQINQYRQLSSSQFTFITVARFDTLLRSSLNSLILYHTNSTKQNPAITKQLHIFITLSPYYLITLSLLSPLFLQLQIYLHYFTVGRSSQQLSKKQNLAGKGKQLTSVITAQPSHPSCYFY